MKTTKRIFTIFLTLFVAGSVWADRFEVDGIFYCYDEKNSREGEVYVAGGSYSGSITIPSTVTYNGITYSVTSIGREAFARCENLTTVIIPNTVTIIGVDAFYKSGLTSINIPNSVVSIGEYAFCWCENLTSVSIPNSVTSIGEHAFNESGLTSINIPNSVTNIGKWAFSDCNFTSITIDSDADISKGDLEFYKNGIKYHILSKTSVEVAKTGRWLDEEETIWFTDYSGDVVIPQSVEFTNNTYVVTGIGEDAFGWCENLTSVTIPNSVTSIKADAFGDCTNLTSIICLTDIPPVIIDRRSGCVGDYDECFGNPFNTGGRNAVTVYVPSEVVSLYKVALDWRSSSVDIQPIPAENVTISKDEVDVKVEKSSADFYMPMNASADSYTLTIKNNGVTFYTLTFNPQGLLANIDFSTTKSYELKADVSAFKFSVTGLSAATDYKYSFKALASNKTVLKEYSGSFTTKNEDGTGGSVQGGGEGSDQGSQGGEGGEGGSTAISEVSNATAVIVVNGQILVNGEAPAFVVTVAGQKIANANLKSGVYFVVADGEMVKVMK